MTALKAICRQHFIPPITVTWDSASKTMQRLESQNGQLKLALMKLRTVRLANHNNIFPLSARAVQIARGFNTCHFLVVRTAPGATCVSAMLADCSPPMLTSCMSACFSRRHLRRLVHSNLGAARVNGNLHQENS
jgi:hypothetical protein